MNARQRPLRIVHCFRSPVGGLFRHVRDLAEMQHRAGHKVGIICDSSTGGAFEDEIFARIAPTLALGLHRVPMRREISLSDLAAFGRIFGDGAVPRSRCPACARRQRRRLRQDNRHTLAGIW